MSWIASAPQWCTERGTNSGSYCRLARIRRGQPRLVREQHERVLVVTAMRSPSTANPTGSSNVRGSWARPSGPILPQTSAG
jgi:hypothetical protein